MNEHFLQVAHASWRIPRRSVCCSRDAEQLRLSSEIFSLIHYDKTEGVLRCDFCPLCWDGGSVLENYPCLLAHWRVERQQHPFACAQIEKSRRILSVLQNTLEIAASFEGKTLNEFRKAFLLAQYLVRMRRFLERRSTTTSLHLYEDVITSDIYSFPVSFSSPLRKEEWVGAMHREIQGIV